MGCVMGVCKLFPENDMIAEAGAAGEPPEPVSAELADLLEQHVWMLDVLFDLQDYALKCGFDRLADDLRSTGDALLGELYRQGNSFELTLVD